MYRYLYRIDPYVLLFFIDLYWNIYFQKIVYNIITNIFYIIFGSMEEIIILFFYKLWSERVYFS